MEVLCFQCGRKYDFLKQDRRILCRGCYRKYRKEVRRKGLNEIKVAKLYQSNREVS